MKNKTVGNVIIPSNVYPMDHEIKTARVLADYGHNIEFLIPVQIKGAKTPDILMNGIRWEIKSPIGKSNSTIHHAIDDALEQSFNIIIDLRRIKIDEKTCFRKINFEIKVEKNIKKMFVITKNRQLIEMKI